MGKSLSEWIEENKAEGLSHDIAIHAESGPPEDIARLVMISVRQWAEERYGKKA